ncbi:MAG: 2-dehydro-3-deoxy-6-phosphogalactonate aldolase [Candidatus Sulfotelmatobacter sp.]
MLRDVLQQSGLIAILRGLRPAEAIDVAEALYQEGLRVLEVPLNTPLALLSIQAIRKALPPDCLVGAGTVTTPAQVAAVREAGGEIIVMPHGDRRVLDAAIITGLDVLPGVATPTEAFAALAAGATLLKLFPADHLGPAVLRAWLAVLPPEAACVPVGGIHPENLREFLRAGAIGVGIGSALYQAGMTSEAAGLRARRFVEAWNVAKRLRRTAASETSR